jgi:hypothetical protein
MARLYIYLNNRQQKNHCLWAEMGHGYITFIKINPLLFVYEMKLLEILKSSGFLAHSFGLAGT